MYSTQTAIYFLDPGAEHLLAAFRAQGMRQAHPERSAQEAETRIRLLRESYRTCTVHGRNSVLAPPPNRTDTYATNQRERANREACDRERRARTDVPGAPNLRGLRRLEDPTITSPGGTHLPDAWHNTIWPGNGQSRRRCWPQIHRRPDRRKRFDEVDAAGQLETAQCTPGNPSRASSC